MLNPITCLFQTLGTKNQQVFKKNKKIKTCLILSSLANQNIPGFLTDISLNIDIFKCNSPLVLILVSLHRLSLSWIFWECLKSFSYWHISLSLCFLQTEILIIATSPRLWTVGPFDTVGPQGLWPLDCILMTHVYTGLTRRMLSLTITGKHISSCQFFTNYVLKVAYSCFFAQYRNTFLSSVLPLIKPKPPLLKIQGGD